MFSLPIRVWSEGLCATLEVPSEARPRLNLLRASSKSSGELSRYACSVVLSRFMASPSCSLGRCLGGLPLFCLIWNKRNKIRSNHSTTEKKREGTGKCVKCEIGNWHEGVDLMLQKEELDLPSVNDASSTERINDFTLSPGRRSSSNWDEEFWHCK